MVLPEDVPPPRPPSQTLTATGSALIETTLSDARITVLHPQRLVIVGSGARVRIDHRGVTRQALDDLRLTLPMPVEATTDEALQQRLAEWAGQAVALEVHEAVRAGERFRRSVQLADGAGNDATLWQGSHALA